VTAARRDWTEDNSGGSSKPQLGGAAEVRHDTRSADGDGHDDHDDPLDRAADGADDCDGDPSLPGHRGGPFGCSTVGIMLGSLG
jgi:hypothetical protein